MEEEVKDKLQDAQEAVQDKIQDLKETIQEKAAEAKEGLQEKAADLKEKAADLKETVQEKAADLKETVQEKAAEAMDDVQEAAQDVAQEAKEIKEDIQARINNEPKPKDAQPAPAAAKPNAPAYQLPTKRGLLKFILLGIITFGIYPLVILTKISGEINTVASRHDGKSTMNYLLLAFIVGPITLQIGTLVWWHRISNRFGAELKRRGLDYSISSSTFWGWCILGSLIAIGPWVYIHKFLKASNMVNADYNVNG